MKMNNFRTGLIPWFIAEKFSMTEEPISHIPLLIALGHSLYLADLTKLLTRCFHSFRSLENSSSFWEQIIAKHIEKYGSADSDARTRRAANDAAKGFRDIASFYDSRNAATQKTLGELLDRNKTLERELLELKAVNYGLQNVILRHSESPSVEPLDTNAKRPSKAVENDIPARYERGENEITNAGTFPGASPREQRPRGSSIFHDLWSVLDEDGTNDSDGGGFEDYFEDEHYDVANGMYASRPGASSASLEPTNLETNLAQRLIRLTGGTDGTAPKDLAMALARSAIVDTDNAVDIPSEEPKRQRQITSGKSVPDERQFFQNKNAVKLKPSSAPKRLMTVPAYPWKKFVKPSQAKKQETEKKRERYEFYDDDLS
jgi:hypothetical protein